MENVKFLSEEELESGIDFIKQSPDNEGLLKMIVCRPRKDKREILKEGEITLTEGLVGDSWKSRVLARNEDWMEQIERQITIMNSRAITLIAASEDRWPLAGDQLYVDLNLDINNLPAGSRLSIGEVILEVTDKPHLGCRKFAKRYGMEAMKFVNSDMGKNLHLRGINAKVIRGGKIATGDIVKKL